MRLFRPLPRGITRPLSWLAIAAWVVSMGVLVDRSYLRASSLNLATDLARYGSTAQWRGVYYRGEKIGFSVSQTVPTDAGYELQEDAQLQMSLLGATTPAAIRTTARVDRAFALQSFEFSLDPGTGPTTIAGTLDGLTLTLAITSSGHTRTETRTLDEPPSLMLSLARRLASEGLAEGARHQWTMFDPATMRNEPVQVAVGRRELVTANGRPLPAFRVELAFGGVQTTSWVTDTGEIVREESPLGLLSVRETPERAVALAVPHDVQVDLLDAAAVVPESRFRIDEPRDVRRLRVRLRNADLSSPALEGAGQHVDGDVVEIVDARGLAAEPAPADLERYLAPEPLIESDAPEIAAETARALEGARTTRERAERLTRYVNALIEKRPTVSIPSAVEVLRTRVGDCNEHTALYVAMARAAGIPARIAVGMVSVRNAFYYHAWPEVFLEDPGGRGVWWPVDPPSTSSPRTPRTCGWRAAASISRWRSCRCSAA
ncbi:MAG: transglutaminase-like domain-containing protein [Vicinamibacterales bacterium]